MGVSGSGKTTIGQLLAEELAVSFIDADDYHPNANIEKMANGIPLNDSDRFPWLSRLNQIAKDNMTTGCVIACSALKANYRIRLADSIESNIVWIYLKGNYEQIYKRMQNRQDHFMGADMLKSQFEALEEPDHAINIDIEDSLEQIVQKIKTELG